MDQFTIHSNQSPFTRGLTSFTMAKMSKFIQNLMKLRMKQDTFWCNAQIPSLSTLPFVSSQFNSNRFINPLLNPFTCLSMSFFFGCRCNNHCAIYWMPLQLCNVAFHNPTYKFVVCDVGRSIYLLKNLTNFLLLSTCRCKFVVLKQEQFGPTLFQC